MTTTILNAARDEDLVICTRRFRCGRYMVFAGVHVRRDHWLVEQFPDAFVPMIPAGLTRENAFIAKSWMKATLGDGSVVIAWPGQYVRRDSPLCTLNPHQFTTPEDDL